MTKSKRVFAEMFAAAQGRQDDAAFIDELCEKYSMIDIIYEMKKYENEHAEPVPAPEPEPVPEPAPVPEPVPVPVPEPAPAPAPEPRQNFWSRLSSDD